MQHHIHKKDIYQTKSILCQFEGFYSYFIFFVGSHDVCTGNSLMQKIYLSKLTYISVQMFSKQNKLAKEDVS